MKISAHAVGRFACMAILIWQMGACGADPCVTLQSPVDFQVFQRRTLLWGSVRIKGVLNEATARVQYRFSGKTLQGELPADWQSLQVEPATHSFDTEVKVPAGGWYKLEIKTGENETATNPLSVEHVGVGEVFVIAGQSNSTNFGSDKQKCKTGNVATFDGKCWRIADDPQPGAQDNSKGGSFMPAFGDELNEHCKVPIGVAAVGFGGTSVREWLPKGQRMKQQPTTGKHVTPVGPKEWEATGELFDGLMRRISTLGSNGFRAVLWHQGESDAGQARAGYPAERQITGEQYSAWLAMIIEKSRKQAGWEFPWFVAQATYHSAGDAADEEFRAAQKSLWEKGIALEGPDTDKLGAKFRKGVHFNSDGLQEHGKLWAQKVSAFLDKLAATK